MTEVAQHNGDDVAQMCRAFLDRRTQKRHGGRGYGGADPAYLSARKYWDRMFNVIGETIDEKGEVDTDLGSIHTQRRLRRFEEQDTIRTDL